MKIPNDMVGLLIGKGGETIRNLQNKTNAIIQVTRDTDLPPGTPERPVTILGTPQQIQAAQAEIRMLIQVSFGVIDCVQSL